MVLPKSRPAYMTSKEQLAIALKRVKSKKLFIDVKIKREVFRSTQIFKERDKSLCHFNSTLKILPSSTLSWQQLYQCHIIRCFFNVVKLRTEIQRRVSARVAGQFLPYCA